ncbi:MAG: pyridoxal phosphate-dependent aminotransferase, partial [candidate division Zixibacteria bacterium]|nr:pyridoxal phosphate-dependent aminotransferase [candidate division Zixibacteria bacterium]
MPASPIRKMIPLSDEVKKKGVKVYHLNIGQPDIPTPVEFMNAVKNYPNKVLEYGN